MKTKIMSLFLTAMMMLGLLVWMPSPAMAQDSGDVCLENPNFYFYDYPYLQTCFPSIDAALQALNTSPYNSYSDWVIAINNSLDVDASGGLTIDNLSVGDNTVRFYGGSLNIRQINTNYGWVIMDNVTADISGDINGYIQIDPISTVNISGDVTGFVLVNTGYNFYYDYYSGSNVTINGTLYGDVNIINSSSGSSVSTPTSDNSMPGYVVYTDNVSYVWVKGGSVCELNGVPYSSFEDALYDAENDGGIIKLLMDISTGGLYFPAGIAIDLNGFTLSADGIEGNGISIKSMSGLGTLRTRYIRGSYINIESNLSSFYILPTQFSVGRYTPIEISGNFITIITDQNNYIGPYVGSISGNNINIAAANLGVEGRADYPYIGQPLTISGNSITIDGSISGQSFGSATMFVNNGSNVLITGGIYNGQVMVSGGDITVHGDIDSSVYVSANAALIVRGSLRSGFYADVYGGSLTVGGNIGVLRINNGGSMVTVDGSVDSISMMNYALSSSSLKPGYYEYVSNYWNTPSYLWIKDHSSFVAATNITGVPTTATAGTPLTLTGTVIPSDATNKSITWSNSWYGYGGEVLGNIVYPTNNLYGGGVIYIRATIKDGLGKGQDYQQDFDVTVIAPNSDYVCEIDGVGYTSLSAAMYSIPENTQGEIKLLTDYIGDYLWIDGRDVIIDLDGHYFRTSGIILDDGDVTINGDFSVVDRIEVTGSGRIIINGDVDITSLTVAAGATAIVNGDVYGDVSVGGSNSEGVGTLTVHGNVYGDLTANYGATATIYGDIYGKSIWNYGGTVDVYGDVNIDDYIAVHSWGNSSGSIRGTLTIDGALNLGSKGYINIDGVYVPDKSQVSSKQGYYEFTGGTSYIWVTDSGTLTVTIPNAGAYGNYTVRLTAPGYESSTTLAGSSVVFGGLSINRQYKAELLSPAGVLFGVIEGISFSEGLNVGVSFSNLPAPQTFTVTLTKPGGGFLTDGYEIYWYLEDSTEVFATGTNLAGLLDGATLRYEIVLLDELGDLYEALAEGWITVSGEGENTLNLNLVLSLPLAVGGRVTSGGQSVAGATVTVASRLNSSTPYESTVFTDADGYFEAEAYAGNIKVYVTKTGFADRERSYNITAAGNIGVIALERAEGTVVALNMTYTTAVVQGDTPLIIDLTSARNLLFTLRNLTKGRDVTAFALSGMSIVIDDDTVAPGDSIRVRVADISGNMIDAETVFTFGAGEIYLSFTQKGYWQAQISSEKNNMALLYGSDGKYINTFYGNVGIFGDVLSTGQYSVVFINQSNLIRQLGKISDFDMLGLSNGTDYARLTFNVTPGVITDLGIINIPDLDETKFYYTDQNRTFVTFSKSEVVAGTPVIVRAEYAFADKYAYDVSSVNLIVSLPEGCEVVANSVMLGVKPAQYVLTTSGIEVQATDVKGVLYFYIIPVTAENHAVNMFTRFSYGGNVVTQPVGTAVLRTETLKINAPDKTRDKTVAINGVAAPDSTVVVFDNDVIVGTTRANAVGSWQLQFELVKPYTFSFHEIYVESSIWGATSRSESKSLWYDISIINLSKVTMYTGIGIIEFDFKNPSTVRPSYIYDENFPVFTFAVEFDNPEAASDVYVITEDQSGRITRIETIYDPDKKLWVGSHSYDVFSLPVSLKVDYYFPEVGTIILDPEEAEDLMLAYDQAFTAQEGFEEILEEILSTVQVELVDSNKVRLRFDEEFYFSYEINTITQQDLEQMLDDPSFVTARTTTGFYNLSKMELTGDELLMVNVDGEKLIKTVIGMPVESTEEEIELFKNVQSFLPAAAEFVRILADQDNESFEKQMEVIEKDIITYAKEASTIVDICDLLTEKYGPLARWIQKNPIIADLLKGLSIGLTGGILIMDLEEVKKEESKLLWEIYNLTCVNEFNRFLLEQRTKLWGMNAAGIKFALDSVNGVLDIFEFLAKFLGYWVDTGQKMPVYYDGIIVYEFIPDGGKIYVNKFLEDPMYKGLRSQIENLIRHFNATPSRLRDAMKDAKKEDCDCNEANTGGFCPGPGGGGGTGGGGFNMSYRKYVAPKYDPSGYVYEAVESNRLEGVTTTVWFSEYEDGRNAVNWDAAEYDQRNPLITDAAGRYAWDVPFGWWQVMYEKDGYETTYSEWLPVPPVQTEVNIGMISTATPNVVSASGYENYIEIAFDRYMDTASLTNGSVTILSGYNGGYSIGFVDAEPDPYPTQENDGKLFAGVVRIVPQGGKFEMGSVVGINISNGAKSYAGIPLQNTSFNLTITYEPLALAVQEEVNINYGESRIIEVAVIPAEAGVNKTITAISTSPYIAAVNAEAVTDGGGIALFTVSGELPGAAEIIFTLENTQLVSVMAVKVGMPGETAPIPFVAVTNISGVPTTTTAETPLPLTGTVVPSDATNQDIVWSVKSVGTTGATLAGNTLNATTAGTVVVTATVANGSAEGAAYTQDFTITVEAAQVELPDIQIIGYETIGVTRVGLTNYDYEVRAKATNYGGSAVNVTAVLTGWPSNVTVLDGSLSFGNIEAGATATSVDTFTIRLDRTVVFDESQLKFTFSYDDVP